MDFFDDYQGPDDLATGPRTGLGENTAAQFTRARLVGNVGAEAESYRRAYAEINTLVKSGFGVDLPNPIHDGDRFDPETKRFQRRDVWRTAQARAPLFRDWHAQQVKTLRARNAELFDQLGLARGVDDRVTDMMRRAENTANDVYGRANAGMGFAGSLVGGLGASLFDPVQVATLPLGGGGTSVARRMFSAGMANAGTAAASYPLTTAAKDRAGAETGFADFAHEVGLGAAFGAGMQGGGEVVRAGVRRWRAPANSPEGRLERLAAEKPELVQRAADGDAAATAELIKAARLDELPAVRGEQQATEIDEATAARRPAGVDADEHAATVNDVVRAIEEPGAPHPVMPHSAGDGPPPIPDQFNGPEGVDTYMGKPMHRRLVDPRAITFDAEAFQYKLNGDARGVRNDLAAVEKWDSLAAQGVMVFETIDGRLIVADGHQRTGLAQRLLDEGRETSIRQEAFVFREADGWTPGEVRALATRRNLQQGTGDATDTAVALREMPHILDKTVRRGTEHMRTALGLAKLDDDIFRMVRAGALAQSTGRIIGERLSNPLEQRAAVDLIQKLGLKGEDTIAAFVDEVKATGARQDKTFDLFGDQDTAVSLAGQLAELKPRVADLLKQNAKAFKRVNEAADVLEARENVIARDVNSRVSTASRDAAVVVNSLSVEPGPLRDILLEGAARMAAGEKVGKVARDVANQVADLAEQKGMQGLMPREPATPAGLRALEPKLDDPAGPAAKLQSDAMERELTLSLPDSGKPKGAAKASPGRSPWADEFPPAFKAWENGELTYDYAVAMRDKALARQNKVIDEVFQEDANHYRALQKSIDFGHYERAPRALKNMNELYKKRNITDAQDSLIEGHGLPVESSVDFWNDIMEALQHRSDNEATSIRLASALQNLPTHNIWSEMGESQKVAIFEVDATLKALVDTGLTEKEALRRAADGSAMSRGSDHAELFKADLQNFANLQKTGILEFADAAANSPSNAVPGLDRSDFTDGAKAGGDTRTRADVLAEVKRLDDETDLLIACIGGKL